MSVRLRLTPRQWVWRCVKFFLFIYFGVFAALLLLQRQLIYPADIAALRGPLKNPVDYGLEGFKEITLITADNVKLIAWIHLPKPQMPIVLYLHGNGMYLSGRAARYQALADAGFGVMALSWRGYGRSEGTPSEEGFYTDARTAIEYLKRGTAPIIVFGESIGTGPAIQMATEYPLAGLVLQAAYTSIPERVREIYWFFPIPSVLIRDHFDSLSKIARVKAPVLFFHGDQDHVIPLAHGQKLFAAATARKALVVVQGADHLDIPDAQVVSSMQDFFIVPASGSAISSPHPQP